MVVRHCHHHVEGAATRAHEHGVGRVGAAGVDAFGLRGLHRRADDVQLFAAEQPALACVRVQPRHRDARPLQADAGVGDADRAEHGVEGDGVDGRAQRLVDGDEHHAQFLVGQHHAHRWRHAVGRGLGRQCLQQFGVAGKRHAGRGQRFLVDGRGDERCRLAGLHAPHRMFDAARRRGAVAGVDHAPGQRRQRVGQARRHQHRQAARRHRGQVGRRIDHRRHRRAGTAQHVAVAHHHGVGQGAGQEGLDDGLGADAGGVAHRHQQGQRRHWIRRRAHAGLPISMKRCSSPKCAATCAATAGAP